MTATEAAAPAAPPALELGPKLLARAAKLLARRAAIEADLAANIAPLKVAADKKQAPIAAELDTIFGQLGPWWDEHGDHYTNGKAKSAEIAGMVIGRRAGSKFLAFTKGDDKAAVAALLKARLVRFLRRTPALDKVAITAARKLDPDGAVAKLGFKTQQNDDIFFAEPAVHTGRK